MKILATGLHGLVGSRLEEILSAQYSFENVSRSEGTDITALQSVVTAFTESDAPIVLHLAAKTNVDGCEEERGLGTESEAWRINVNGTKNVVEACRLTGKKLIHISTDFVFDGEKEFYTEDDAPHPINWYGETKLQAELVVEASSIPWTIVRLSYPYRAQYVKNDFMRAMKARLENHEPVKGVHDLIFTPTFLDDFAYAIKTLIEHDATGIYHVVGDTSLSPYDAAMEIANVFGLDNSVIAATTREEFFAGKAMRPFRSALKHDKISALGVQMHSFHDGLLEVEKQL